MEGSSHIGPSRSSTASDKASAATGTDKASAATDTATGKASAATATATEKASAVTGTDKASAVTATGKASAVTDTDTGKASAAVTAVTAATATTSCYDTDDDDTADWCFGGPGDDDVHGLGAGVFEEVFNPDFKMYVGGRVTKFEPLQGRDFDFVELDVLPKMMTRGHAVIRRKEFGPIQDDLNRTHQHRKAISFGCVVASNLLAMPRHVVVICDYTFKSNWMRSNIHIQAEGGGVLTHREFNLVMGEVRCSTPFDPPRLDRTRWLLRDATELERTLFILQGRKEDVSKSRALCKTQGLGCAKTLSLVEE